ncbi:MAG TPA: serine hydrolase domain-containing protein, partial [Longimicrobiales bacterium]
IGRYFKDVPADKSAITIHHLLTHMSGLRSSFGGDYSPISRDSLVKVALASTLNAAPGARYQYSNTGYSLLGAIIEIVSGQPYERFLNEQVLRPAGITTTGYRLANWPAPLAVGYRGNTRFGTPLDKAWAPDGPYWHLRANGGLLSTVGDLYRWQRAFTTNKVLSAASFTKATSQWAPDGSSAYGYGLSVGRTGNGGRVIGHDGGNGYFYARMRNFLDDNAVVIFATNDNANRRLENDIVQLMNSLPVAEIPAIADVAVPIERYGGAYRTSAGVDFEARIVGKSLEISPAPSAITGAFLLEPQKSSASFDSVVAQTINGMMSGDFANYRNRFLATGNFKIDDEVEFWTQVFKDWRDTYGAYRSARILGASDARLGVEPVRATYVAVAFERGERVIRLLQPYNQNDKFFIATVSAASWPVRFPIVPRSATEFATYNFELAKGGAVTFRVDADGTVRGLTLPDGTRADKVR